jgi:hypothetical protein
MAAHQAGGSCHKGPSGASARGGMNGPKIVKNPRLLRSGSFRALGLEPIGFPTIPGRRPECRIATSHGLAAALRVIAATAGEAHYVQPPRRGGVAAGSIKVFDGLTMTGDQDRAAGKNDAEVKDLRRDRLKLALRENLKRRKSQARGRGEASASSESADASLDTASGEKP